jgi:neutral ceramidase
MPTSASSVRLRALASNPSVLFAGTGLAEITPPLEVGFLMSSVEGRWEPFRSVRTPLTARALVLEFGQERVALISLDLLGLHGKTVGGWAKFKRAIARAANSSITADRIVITCTHTHSAPESTAVTDLYRTEAFQQWAGRLIPRIGKAIANALGGLKPCTLHVAVGELAGFSLQRRIPRDGRIVMSDSLQPISSVLMKRKPVDHRVHSLQLRGSDSSIVATLIHASCHPVHEMCYPHISADFPGELYSALKRSEGMPIFFNGAAGDINPPTVSGGPTATFKHGAALGEIVNTSVMNAEKVAPYPFAFSSRTIKLPMRSLNGKPSRNTIEARMAAVRIGSVALLFLPGEIFVETAQKIETSSPFNKTIIVGFTENSIGYVPTERAFEEGGYEIGPGKWSFLQSSAESIIRHEATKLLDTLSCSEGGKRITYKVAQSGHESPCLQHP